MEGTPTQAQYDALTDAEREEFEAYMDEIDHLIHDHGVDTITTHDGRLTRDTVAVGREVLKAAHQAAHNLEAWRS